MTVTTSLSASRHDQRAQVFLHFFLYILALSLPLSEALKQIATVGLIFSGAYLVYLRHTPFRRDLALYGALLLAAASIFSIPWARDPSGALHGAISIIKILAVFLILRELSLDNKSILRFFFLLFLSFVVAVFWGEYNLVYGIKKYLELKSVGHVNHSAIYMGIITICAYGFLFLHDNQIPSGSSPLRIKTMAYITLVIGTAALVIAGSRGAVIGTFVPILATFFLSRQYRDPRTVLFILVLAGIFVITLLTHDYSLSKFHEGVTYDSGRIPIWIASWKEFWHQNILVGMGAKNFHYINLKSYFPDYPLEHISHAHNTFITFLLEKGMIGVIGYLIFLLGILKELLFTAQRDYLRIIALNLFFLNLIVSMVNTTFHDENALLMGIIWAMALQRKN